MKAKSLIDSIFEAEGQKEQAQVRVELTGTPQAVQKAIKQLAKQKPAGVKVKTDTPVDKIDDEPKAPEKKEFKPVGGGKPKGDKPADKPFKKAEKKDDKPDGDDDSAD